MVEVPHYNNGCEANCYQDRPEAQGDSEQDPLKAVELRLESNHRKLRFHRDFRLARTLADGSAFDHMLV
ncbi:MAG: hypothetical protein WCF26_18205 [Candidatus Sulfotelmatobacter sp.]